MWQRPGAGGWWLGWWLVAGLVKGHVVGGWCGARVEVFGFDLKLSLSYLVLSTYKGC